MVKCDPCNKEVCEKKYDNRHLCEDPSNCTCTCQEPAENTFWKSVGSIALGAAAFTGGVVLTVTTGGLGTIGIAAVVGGGALTGAGATAVIHPVAKQMNGERMTGMEYVKDLAVSGTVGAITGPIGLGGASVTTSIASKVGTESVKQGAVKLACRSAVGAVSGATASTIQEGVNLATNDNADFSVINILKGAALGAATGGASHITGSITNNIDPGVVRSVTKVATDTASTVVIDASCQIITDGKVDGKKLALNAGARAATSAGYEAVSNATYKAHGGKDVLREKLGDKKILEDLDPKDKEAVLKAKEYLENLPPDKVEEQLLLASKAPHINEEIRKVLEQIRKTKTELSDTQNAFRKKQGGFLSDEDKNHNIQQKAKVEQLEIKYKQQRNELNSLQNSKPEMMGEKNIHALERDHVGQFAADLPDEGSESTRGMRRVLIDLKAGKGGTVRYKISGIIENHDYKNAPTYGEVEIPELKVVEPFVLPKEEDEDDDEKKGRKRKLH